VKELEYPFDSSYIMKKSKSLKKALLSDGSDRIHKKIAVLGGSTTHDIIRILELFLLNYGIEPEFYESEYGQYWQDAMFPGELNDFNPDIIYIHTSNRNITDFPTMDDSAEAVDEKLQKTYQHFETMWKKLSDTYHCPIIQNNFEAPFYRLLGNRDFFDVHGRLSFINRLNEKFAEYARKASDSAESFFYQ
jgi:predicted enzyme involved in methoxymalonyl-ACP biosynthesis